jgi:hypothetical protein
MMLSSTITIERVCFPQNKYSPNRNNMDAIAFLSSALGSALVAGALLFGGLFYAYGTDGRYQKMEGKDLLRVFFLPPAIVAATVFWWLSGKSQPSESAANTKIIPAPIEVPAPAAEAYPEFDPVPAPSTPILTEPFAD